MSTNDPRHYDVILSPVITEKIGTASTYLVATAAQVSAVTSNSSSPPNISTDRLRDYVGAFVLAGLDPRVGAEADFFADRVQYYAQGVMSRDQIREDLKQYAARWPERRLRRYVTQSSLYSEARSQWW